MKGIQIQQQYRGLKAIKSQVQNVSLDVNGHLINGKYSRSQLKIEAFKKTKKKTKVILMEEIPSLGKVGDLAIVALGYYRNYLGPYGKAKVASKEALDKIREAEEAKQRELDEILKKAEDMATALRTIGKFVIKKAVNEQGQLFGSVSEQEVIDAIYMQTGQKLDKDNLKLPDIKELGMFDATIKLHAEVMARFKVVVTKEKREQKSKKMNLN